MNQHPPALGSRVAPVVLATTRGAQQLPDPAGRPILLMFFVESGTPDCEAQIGALNADADALEEAGALGVAVSTDPLETLQSSVERAALGGIVLASDADGALARAFGVYDVVQRRAQRAAFVIGGDGTVLAAEPWFNPRNSTQYAALFAALFAAMEDPGGRGSVQPNDT